MKFSCFVIPDLYKYKALRLSYENASIFAAFALVAFIPGPAYTTLLHDELFSGKALNLNEVNAAIEAAHIHRLVYALHRLLHLHIAQNIDNSDGLADRRTRQIER